MNLQTFHCPACLRWKFNPIHWLARLMGICDGKDADW